MSSFLFANFTSSFLNLKPKNSEFFSSKLNNLILQCCFVMKDFGYIEKYETYNVKNKLFLKTFPSIKDGLKLLRKISIISKPSCRVYLNLNQIKRLNIRNKFSLNIISTSKGVMSSHEAELNKIGGEFLCSIF